MHCKILVNLPWDLEESQKTIVGSSFQAIRLQGYEVLGFRRVCVCVCVFFFKGGV